MNLRGVVDRFLSRALDRAIDSRVPVGAIFLFIWVATFVATVYIVAVMKVPD